MDLQSKVVVVTGAAQGLGQAIAVNLAREGAQPILVDTDTEKLASTAEKCQQLGIQAGKWAINVADEASVMQGFSEIVTQYGRLDGLVNNAGIVRDSLFLKVKDGAVQSRMSLADWDAVIRVNLTGVFLCAREAATHMVSQKTGVIVNISSISRAGNMGQTNYAASKSGVVAMTVTWAKELARYGVRVAAVAPGFIETPMTSGMKPEALEKMVAGIPLKRMGYPQEIAQCVQFILENDYITGRVIECDGGLRF